MKPLDDELRRALIRREPSPDLTEMILNRIGEGQKHPPRLHVWSWRWPAAIAAAILVTVAGLSGYREHMRRVNGEKAKQEVLLALRVTSQELRAVQEHLARLQQRSIVLPVDEK